jgi:hypothetical protein
MIDGGNGLTSWFGCFWRNKLTMFGAHCPFNSLTQLAETKDKRNREITSFCPCSQFVLFRFLTPTPIVAQNH